MCARLDRLERLADSSIGRASRYLAPAEPKHPPAPIGPSGQRQPRSTRDHFPNSIAHMRPRVGVFGLMHSRQAACVRRAAKEVQ
jgi:hypothetical protein